MPNHDLLPATDWPTLLRRAPHFSVAIMDALCEDGPSAFAPHIRAIYYFDLFDGQVSNGGVDQYFDNVAAHLDDALQVPGIIAQNPVFAPALPLIEEAHAIWKAVASAYPADTAEDDEDRDDDDHTASDQDDGNDEGDADADADNAAADAYQALLAPYAERLEALAKAFYAIHHDIRQRLEADIVRDPHHYFAIAAVPGLQGRGIEHVLLADDACRLRFEDGFPIGPNSFECADGHCDVVWFSRDRTLLQAETSGFGSERNRQWIHYPSQASGSWSYGCDFMGEARSVRNDRLALGLRHHGLHEYFAANGQRESASLHWHGEELCREHFYADGTPLLRCRQQDRGERQLRYWPNGALNTESIKERDGRTRYLRCLDPDGQDLAPNGNGRLHEMLSLNDEMRQWREGELVAGVLCGPVRRMASRPDGSQARETECTFYVNGRAQ